jgi:cytochrome b
MLRETHVAVKVWDLPVRLFHWVLVVLLVFQFVTGKIGGNLMPLHVYSGYAVLVLVIFRILWGFAGSTHARFASFLAGPAATLRFARRLFSREAVPQVGHNPLGGWMVIALVVSLAVQAVSGLFANDGVATQGPLAAMVSIEVSNDLSQVHRLSLNVLLVLTAVHVAAVLFHWLVKRDNLMGAMFTGVKRVPEAAVRERREARRDSTPRRAPSREAAAASFASPWRALAVLAVALALVYTVVR